ncbi:hypothetical protein [Acutalibacter caecimuris]|uniref:hypothetical protein n=1 Tax=Acutalibacter caecimuris TaxID=3093657 RepID=UPI002AC95CC8|nr:hypothetical protein [Acutalibacter sp. M00118]
MKRQSRDFYDRPLSPEEAQFAAENLNIVFWYLNQRGLSENEWFDVVIFRYLISVKRYLTFPDLQQYRFVNVACKAMKSAIGHEYEKKKRNRRPVEVLSLDDPINGLNDLTYERAFGSSQYDPARMVVYD